MAAPRSNNSVLKSTKAITRAMSRTSSARLRSNLFRKLGIPSTTTSDLSIPTSTAFSVDTASYHPQRSLLGNVQVTRIPLKGEMEEQPCLVDEEVENASIDTVFRAMGNLWPRQKTATCPELSSSISASCQDCDMILEDTNTTAAENRNRTPRSRHIRFDSNVIVVPIPNRHSYSDRMRRFLWNAPDHMKREVTRNTVEYTADGWDYQTALEEEDHYFDPTTQEYIHPVHLDIAHMSFEEQEAILPPNYINPLRQQLMQPPVLVRQESVRSSSPVPTFSARTNTSDVTLGSVLLPTTQANLPHPIMS